MWEALLLNPLNDMALLLDCYLAAASLGEVDSPRLSRARDAIEEFATRMADEFTNLYGEASTSN